MQKEIEFGLWVRAETCSGTWWVPEDLVGSPQPMEIGNTYRYGRILTEVARRLQDLIEPNIEEIYEVEIVEGWGGRMSAPGYLDRTDWVFARTQEEVDEILDGSYGDGDA